MHLPTTTMPDDPASSTPPPHLPWPGPGARRDDLRRTGTAAAVLATVYTGRAGLADRVERHLGAARRSGEQLTVLSIVIDGVTALDGRAASAALVAAATEEFGHRLRSRVRSTDEVLRSGDGEYGVVLPGTGHDGAVVARERLAAALGGLYRLGPDLVAVTLAIGHACFPAAGATGVALLAAAIDARG